MATSGWGGRRPGSGRPKGAKNKNVPQPTDYPGVTTPLEFMLAVMNDPSMAPRRRLAAAIAAVPYCHPKPGGRRPRKPLDWM
jgi:hypothetical protein